MKRRKILISALIAYLIFMSACVYIVVPEGLEKPVIDKDAASKVWNAVATKVEQTGAGDLRIELAIRNDTGDWSVMEAVPDQPATLKSGGKTTDCETVFIGTGAHRLAPGFQMRGYSTGKNADPLVQLLYVECKGASAEAGATLSIDYVSYGGILDYYDPTANELEGTLEINLDEIASDLSYPVAEEIEGLIQDSSVAITALSENVITLQDAQRTDKGLQFTWQNLNPTKFALKTHIGIPPVIGSDGIIYGVAEILDMPEVPITPASGNVQWTTEIVVPQDVSGLYILLSVESKKPRTYVNYAVDITDR